MVIGGLAMIVHGSSKLTADVDVMYRRDRDQATRIANALGDIHPRLRGFPKDLPFIWEASSLLNTTLCTLESDLGDVDLLAEASGSGGYANLRNNALLTEIDGIIVPIASLQDLLNMKRASGRSKDDIHIAELEDWLTEESV